MTTSEVAARLNISVSTVRRYESDRLHPTVDDKDVWWFDEREVAALAAELMNAAGAKRSSGTEIASAPETRTHGELAALVFEHLEQRQSFAEIVIGLRIPPEIVRPLFDQWSMGLTEGQLRMMREPSVPWANELHCVLPDVLAARLVELPEGQLRRISVARYREVLTHSLQDFTRIDELGGFHVSRPIAVSEITRRHGKGAFRVTAYGFDPNGIRWEVLVEGLADGG